MNLKDIEDILKYDYTDKILLETAFTHKSFAHENGLGDYEYLEFVGDSILNMIVTEYLYKNIPDKVGMLSKLKSSLVSTDNLVVVLENLGLSDYIRFGRGIDKKQVKKAYADVVEAIVASMYFDAGMWLAKEFVLEHVIVSKDNVLNHLKKCQDFKSLLQEKLQENGSVKIEYKLVSDSIAHDNSHDIAICLYVNGDEICTCHAKSSAEASQLCAEKMYKDITKKV